MSDKSFKVKSGLQIPGVTSASILSTDSSGNVSSGTTLPIANGGTGQTSANNALNALLPVQGGGTINYVLQSSGTDTAWAKLYNQAIQNNGTTVTPRGYLNIVGGTFSDDSQNDTTTITFGGTANTAVSSNITLAAGTRYFVDTTLARTLTLPASPSLGDEIYIYDASGSASSYNITVARNGNLINGNAGNFLIDISGGATSFVYTGSTYGWKAG